VSYNGRFTPAEKKSSTPVPGAGRGGDGSISTRDKNKKKRHAFEMVGTDPSKWPSFLWGLEEEKEFRWASPKLI